MRGVVRGGVGLDIGIIDTTSSAGHASTLAASAKSCSDGPCLPHRGHASDFGVNAGTDVDWSVTLTRKAIIDQLVGGLGGLLKQRKVTVYDGVGSLGSTDGDRHRC